MGVTICLDISTNRVAVEQYALQSLHTRNMTTLASELKHSNTKSNHDTFCVQIALYASSNGELANNLKKFEKKQERFKTDPFIGKLPHEYFVPIIFRKNTILSKMIKKMIHFVKKMIHL